MLNIHIAPVLLQILRDQPPMTVVRFVLAAKKAAVRDYVCIDFLLDLALTHQIKKFSLIYRPITLIFLVFIKDVLSRGEFWNMNIIDMTDLPQKKLKIITLCETRQLRDIVKAHVNDPLCSRALKPGKKRFRRLLRESNRKQTEYDIKPPQSFRYIFNDKVN